MSTVEEKILITSSVAMFSTRRKVYTVRKSHDNFAKIVLALKDKDTGLAYRLYTQTKPQGKTKIVGNDLFFDGKKFHEAFAGAYAVAKEHGLSTGALDLFFENLSQNPNPISVEAFTAFMAKTRMPITDRGTFLAYKRVDYNYMDHHTGTFDNRPGSVMTMRREDCDADQSATCSTGFHVCSHTYLSHFPSGQDLVVEINPKDVVAVPPDYSLSKMRLASYRVLCTLPYFKEQLLNHFQDALGMIPVFTTAQTKKWDVLSDVEKEGPQLNAMSAEAWLETR